MKNYLGIEFGSTRIKCVVTDESYKIVASGDYTWKSEYTNGIWSYSLDEAITGLKETLKKALKDFDQPIAAVGISGMMHGYLPFDKDWNLLVPFRTWQNTITAESAKRLTEEFGFNVPQRWSIAHLYQALLNDEAHIHSIAHITTLAGYVHHLLTGENVVGIGEASGIFPIDADTMDYDASMLNKFDRLVKKYHLAWNIREVLPKILPAGQIAGALTADGEKLLLGALKAGTRFAPPEGDAGTGMVATNSVKERSGNVSAGTSIFAMLVLEKPLKSVYEEIDVVATPTGKPVAMVHCNNCTNDMNEWVSLLLEGINTFGATPSANDLYSKLFECSLLGDKDCGGVVTLNYSAGEGVTHFDGGRPFVVRLPDAKFTLANFMRSQIYSTFVTLKLGMKILEKEHFKIDSIVGHGGLFKTKGVAQEYLCAALNTTVKVLEASGEGGPYGMALLASYLDNSEKNLEDYLDHDVFADVKATTCQPSKETVEGFEKYTEKFVSCLHAETEFLNHL